MVVAVLKMALAAMQTAEWMEGGKNGGGEGESGASGVLTLEERREAQGHVRMKFGDEILLQLQYLHKGMSKDAFSGKARHANES